MFLKKITGVKGVGRFRSAGIGGGEYSRYTLFYGGNGRGKTTLCAILRSLQRNEPSFISARKTFGHTGDVSAQLLLDTGPVRFENGAWVGTGADIHIFDQQFVGENVHGGQQIDVDQRRAFYRIAVGPKGVALAGDIETLDAEASGKQVVIGTETRALQQHVPKELTLDQYLALPDLGDQFDDAISNAEFALKAAEGADAIATHALMSGITLPGDIIPEIEACLAKGLGGVSADAAASVAAHLQKHKFETGGEAWLQLGLEHADGDCPFCARPLEGVDLVAAYKGFFSEAYAAHYNSIKNLRDKAASIFSETTGLRLRQSFAAAGEVAGFWSEYGLTGYSVPAEAEDAAAALKALGAAMLAMLDAKLAAPLEAVSVVSLEFADARQRWADVRAKLVEANADAALLNEKISALKSNTQVSDAATARGVILRLKAAQKRHAEPVASMAANLLTLVDEKAEIVARKEAKKAELDEHDAAMLDQYQASVNVYLKRFDAGFEVSQSSKNYMGGVPQSSFCLRFGATEVDVARSGDKGPTFGSTLSAGDKNTFALAFFLAQLERDSEISKKVVVFDDPFTSLDDYRREVTAKAIVRVGEKAAQAIVLSHDKFFLDSIRAKIFNAQWAAMQIAMSQNNSSLMPWDIEREVKEGYLQVHMELSEFADGIAGTAKDMRTKMRPLLEKYIRYRFPNAIDDNKWLGDMCGIIRNDPLHPLQGQLTELDDINQFTAPYHHDPDHPFNEDEVRAHVKRTLAIVGGC